MQVRAGTPDFENPPPKVLRQISARNAKAKVKPAAVGINDSSAAAPTIASLPATSSSSSATDSKSSAAASDMKQPLLPAANGTSDSKDNHTHIHTSADSSAQEQPKTGKDALSEADRYVMTQDAQARARVRIGVLFLVTTTSQVFTGRFLMPIHSSTPLFPSYSALDRWVLWIRLENGELLVRFVRRFAGARAGRVHGSGGDLDQR